MPASRQECLRHIMRNVIVLFITGGATLSATAAVTKKPVQHKTAASHSKHSRTKHASAQTWRNRQLEPTPDRYKEIQEALSKKGYLHEEATGKWDEESSDALRRFQHDQNLEPSGKLNSLSLIALGLGPTHEAAPAGTPQAVPPSSATPPPAPHP